LKTKKIPPALHDMLEEGYIDEVVERLLSGKEASLFVVRKGDDYIAAKVYKPRQQRSFKNIASYVDGRNQTRNTRDKRAQAKKTTYGRELMETSWRQMEYDALCTAHTAGVRVPEPILLHGDVLLMELLTDEHGNPALRLADLELNDEVAELLHQEVFQQVRLLLQCGLIHGDLSVYNILVAYNGLNLIDLPQAVNASANQEARDILHRDLKNVTEYLARFAPRLQAYTDCGLALFRHYERGTLTANTTPQKNRQPRRPREGKRADVDESLQFIREASDDHARRGGGRPTRRKRGGGGGAKTSGRPAAPVVERTASSPRRSAKTPDAPASPAREGGRPPRERQGSPKEPSGAPSRPRRRRRKRPQ